MIITQLFRQFISGPRPQFKKGDTVRRPDGDELMTILWVHVSEKTQRITYLCKWFDHQQQTKRTNLFIESQLRSNKYRP